MSRDTPPYALGDLVNNSLSALGLHQGIREQMSIIVWDEVVGSQIASATRPEFVRDGMLFVLVKNSVWSNELALYKSDIINRLNKRLGARTIRDIVFKVGKLPSPRRAKTEPEAKDLRLEGISLSDDELEQVEAVAGSAGDPQLKESLRGILITALRLEKWKKIQGWRPCSKCGALQNGSSTFCPLCRMQTAEMDK
ncbi:MAG: DciA family protein [Armatimonadota bacterium]|nr:DciA family protein [Armatimonadota bacterium]